VNCFTDIIAGAEARRGTFANLGRSSMLRVWLMSIAVSFAGSFPVLAQDTSAGAKIFTQCHICHQIGEKAQNETGPVLNGIIGRPAAAMAGYDYSPAMRNSGLTWDEATFASYIRNPRGVVPGTKMSFAGLKTDQQVADLIAYLRRFDQDGRQRP
jgi:cytochrome c